MFYKFHRWLNREHLRRAGPHEMVILRRQRCQYSCPLLERRLLAGIITVRQQNPSPARRALAAPLRYATGANVTEEAVTLVTSATSTTDICSSAASASARSKSGQRSWAATGTAPKLNVRPANSAARKIAPLRLSLGELIDLAFGLDRRGNHHLRLLELTDVVSTRHPHGRLQGAHEVLSAISAACGAK